jgi:chromosome segregation ATPase
MDAEWLTYREAAKRLGSNIEAVRQRAIRCRWPRTIGNDKRALIQIPEGLTDPSQEGNDRGSQEGNETASRRADERAYERPFIKALEAHVETLKRQLATAEARLAQQVAESADREARQAADLAAERARTEKQAADFHERDAQAAVDLAAERAQTAAAIAAFASLAERLDALAAERERRPWWRRLRALR